MEVVGRTVPFVLHRQFAEKLDALLSNGLKQIHDKHH